MIPYDPRLSLLLADAAVASYRDGSDIVEWAAERGYSCRHWSEGAAQAAVFASLNGPVIVAMRGTDQGLDWRVDTRFWRVKRSWWGFPVLDTEGDLVFGEDGRAVTVGSLHRGFVSYAERLAPLIAEEVERWPDRPVHVCGHSLGGALSYLIARHLWRRGHEIATVHAFSSPRVGDLAWAQAYDASELGAVTFRVVAVNRGEQDLVTQTPPAWAGYWHSGRPVIVTADGRYETEEAWELVRQGLPMRWRLLSRLIWSAKAHPTNLLLSVLTADARRAAVPELAPVLAYGGRRG